MFKRGFDVIFAISGLLFLSPLLVIVAAWVKIDSPGPIFFRQERVGRQGAVFRILKFRSMSHAQVERGRLITVANDERVTRVGALIRACKIDELPQLYNVLIGDMSMVGPRPEVPKYVAMYPDLERSVIQTVRPGITDVASLMFRDEARLLGGAVDPEEMYVKEILPVKVVIYSDYVRTRSFWGDLVIIVKTVAAVVSRGRDEDV